MRPLKTTQNDLAGHGFFRVFVVNLFDKVIPLGNFRNGPGLKPALVLLGLHWCGRLLFGILIRQEHRLHRVYQFLRRRR